MSDKEHENCADENDRQIAISLLLSNPPFQRSLHVASWKLVFRNVMNVFYYLKDIELFFHKI